MIQRKLLKELMLYIQTCGPAWDKRKKLLIAAKHSKDSRYNTMTELLICMIVFIGPQHTLPSWKTSIEIDLVQGGSISRNTVEFDNFCTKIWFPGPGYYYTTSFFFNPILLALERHPYPKLNELSVGKKLFFTQSLLFLQ